jgi:Glycosyltransferase family 87
MIADSFVAPSTSPRLGIEAGRARSDRLPLLVLGGLVASGLIVALTVARTRQLLPSSIRVSTPSYLAGAFAHSGVDVGLAGLIVVLGLMCVFYALAVRVADRLPMWALLMAIAALYTLVLLAPPILSTDVFSYVAYSRLGALYHINPYLHGPDAISLDALYPFVGPRWITTPTVYGPLFTGLGYVLASFDVAAQVLVYKLVAAVSGLLVIVIVWRAAALRGLNQARAVTLVGLNPVTILYGVGGGHNDLLMLAVLMGAVYLVLRQRDGASGALIVVAAAVKLSGGLLLPFALANGRPRGDGRRPSAAVLAGATVATVLIGLPSLVLFGPSVLHLLSTLQGIQSHGGEYSIHGWILSAVGLQRWIGPVGIVLDGLCVAAVARLTVRVWRGGLDWITAAGWATVWMLVTAGFLLPWYVAWLIPLAALSRDRRLLIASVILTAICMTTL